MTQSALLLMVHGSPRPESNADVHRVADDVRARGGYEPVVVCFMECNEPSIPAAVDVCVKAGADRIFAVPYFLHTGNHVATDLPEILQGCREKHPRIEILMSSYVGRSKRVTAIVAERAAAALQNQTGEQFS